MLYAIGDLHLSFEANKPMDVFGKRWVGYVEKLRRGLSVIGPEDTTVLLGDLSWSMDLEHAVADFGFISAIPGRKIILKGNHDYWWTTAAKFYRFCQEHDYKDMWVLNNNCYSYDGIAICGTRGWFYEEDRQGTHDEKVFRRELIRLETASCTIRLSIGATSAAPFWICFINTGSNGVFTGICIPRATRLP